MLLGQELVKTWGHIVELNLFFFEDNEHCEVRRNLSPTAD